MMNGRLVQFLEAVLDRLSDRKAQDIVNYVISLDESLNYMNYSDWLDYLDSEEFEDDIEAAVQVLQRR